ncbi:MAG TPA: multicopper oxidase domain-containing protein [Propionicimonas sp.]|nr:multicopper oxidase domain-containing protein [Propionicimonas sp.]
MTASTPTGGPRPLPGQDGAPVQRGALAVAGVVAVVALSLAAVLARPALAGSPAASSTPDAPVASAAATGHTTEVTVTIEGMAFSPSTVEVPVGDALRVTVLNEGDQRHDLVFANGAETGAVAPGARATLEVGVVDADLDGWCSLPGHRQMGMTLQVIAVGAEPTSDDGHGTGTGTGDHATPAAPGDLAVVPSMADLLDAAAAATPFPAELAPLGAETEHAYTFTVTEQVEAVAAGLTREVWTYNGTSPGPVLHGRVGDTFRITLVNEGTAGHSIDFHAGELAPDGPMRTIEPGESLEYTFTARRAGIWMYHCSTMPMSHHIANGMFGAVVIEPAELESVDRQYVLVQSEQYLGADGGPADAAKVAAGIPDLVTFNGRAFQYDAHPLTAGVGDRVRIWVLDAGPNASWSFHVVGTQFDTVWSEGAYTVRHGAATDGLTPGTTGAQTLALLAAEGGFVELVPVEAGHYALVNHQMSLAEKGAHGILEVTD